MRFSFRAFVVLALPAVLVLFAPLALSDNEASASAPVIPTIETTAIAPIAPASTSSSTTSTSTSTSIATPPSSAVGLASSSTTTPTTSAAPETTTTVATPQPTSAPTDLIPSWFAAADRPTGACATPSGSQRLGYTETFFGQGFCASTGHGTATDLYIFTHEIFHAATAITDETIIDCLAELYLGTELPAAAYGCQSPETHRDLYETIMAGAYPRPPQEPCEGELAPHHSYNVWTCTTEIHSQ